MDHTDPTLRVNAALAELVRAAAELGAKSALVAVQTVAPARLVPLKQAAISYRHLLELIRRGELQAFGVGNRKFVDREMVDRWLLEHPIGNSTANSAERDELEAIVQANRTRKAKRKGATK